MHKIHFCLFILVIAVSSFGESNLNDVVTLYTNATGGKDAIEKVQSVEISLTIEEPTFKVDAIYRADRNIRMRIDVYGDGKRVFTEAFDGKTGWQMGEDGKAKDASPEGSAALRNGIFLPGKLFGLHELASMGHKLSYQGQEEVDATRYEILKLNLDSGFETYLYINSKDGQIERTRDQRALHVDIDPTKKLTESVSSDFRKIDGVLYAFKSVRTDLKTKQVVQTTTVREIKLNPKIDESIFIKP